MNTLVHKILLAGLFAFSTMLVSCGGGGGGGDSDSTGEVAGGVVGVEKGTVTLLVTDAPSDDFKEINLTILKAELLCDAGKEELFSGLKEFDLLQLTEVTEIFSVSEVSAGYCNKIRLHLSQIVLVPKDSSKPDVYAKILGNGKLDLLSKYSFYVGPDNPLYIQLDFDAKKSIQIKGKADYNFRPVVFIKIVEDRFDTKLIRQRGTVENLDGESEEFDLCLIEAEIQPVPLHEDDDSSDDDTRDCVRVDTTDAPDSIFDDYADPISFQELENGDIATVVGRFSFYQSKSDDNSSDDNSSNDKSSNDKSSNDNSSDDNSSDDGSSDDDSSDDTGNRPGMVLAAEVIWTGNEIAQTTNVACSGVTTDEVTTDDDTGATWYKNYELPVPDGGKICITPGSTRTILQPGAKIYDSKGNELDDSYIAEGILNKVDAYADAASKPPVDPKAVLVMLGLDDPLNPLDQLTGVIGAVDVDFLDNELSNLMLLTDEGDRCVNFDNVETEVFETRLEDDNINFDQKSVFSLRSGQKANVFGTENSSGCLDAETIIYEDEGAVIQPI
jgi:hypothetical protein